MNRKLIFAFVLVFVLMFSLVGAKSFTVFNSSNSAQPYFSINGTTGYVGLGTENPGSILQIPNNGWFSAKNYAGTGLVNLFKVNTNDQIEIGGTLNIGSFEFDADSGLVTFVDMPVTSSASVGTPEGYSFKIDGDNLLTVYAESDGAGGVQNKGIGIGTITPQNTFNVIGDGNFTGNLYSNGAQVLTSFSESDPYWSSNYTAYNATWSSTYNATYNTWAYNQTIPSIAAAYNGTLAYNASLAGYYELGNPYAYYNTTTIPSYVTDELDPYWSENFTLYNTTWSYYEADTNTWNTSSEIWAVVSNGTFYSRLTNEYAYYNSTNPPGIINSSYYVDNTHNYWNSTFATFNKTYADTLYSGVGEPLWSDNFTLYNSTWSSTYNSTYNTWAYNQTIPAINYADVTFLRKDGDNGTGIYNFGGSWNDGGLTIQDGDLYAQTIYVYNITSLQVNDLKINGSIYPQNGFDNTFDIGAADRRWRDLFIGGNMFANGTINSTGGDICIEGGNCLSGALLSGNEVDPKWTGNKTLVGFLAEAETISANWVNTANPWAVNEGGTGTNTLTDHGVMLGSGTGAVTITAAGTSGYALVGQGAADPTWVDVVTQAELSGAETDPKWTGNYTAKTGTGNVVFSASPTFTGTVGAAALTLSGAFDPNGVITLPTTGISGAGTGSGLDADLLDGLHATTFYNASNPANYITLGEVPAVSDVWVNESGDTMTGNLNMSNNNITDVVKLILNDETISTEQVNFDGDTSAGLKLSNNDGYVTLTPLNSGWAHIYTDRAKFIFNQPVYSVDDAFSSYDADLLLQRAGVTKLTLLTSSAAFADSTITAGGNTMWHAGNDGSTSTLDADLLDGLHATTFYNASNPAGYISSYTETDPKWTGNKTLVGFLAEAETISANWVNTANPWADAEVANAITISGGVIGSNSISGTLTTTGALIIGDGGDAISINSNDWDISTTGVITGASMTSTQLTDGGTIGFDWVVGEGGTGVSSLTDHGVVLGSGTGAVTVTTAGTSGYALVGQGAADPTWVDVITETEMDTLAEWDTQIALTGTQSAANFLRGDGAWTTGVLSTTNFGASIDDTEMTAEDFGEFTCTGGEDGCSLDTGTFDDEYIELADNFGGDVSGTYGAINVNKLETLGTYVWNASDTPRTHPTGVQVSFVQAGGYGYPNYGTVLAMSGYSTSQDGGIGEIFIPYSSAMGGPGMQYRYGEYNNAGYTAWKKVVDESTTFAGDVTGTIKATVVTDTDCATESVLMGDGTCDTKASFGDGTFAYIDEPFWSANLTAHNASWNYYEADTDTWNTSAEIWAAISNGTFYLKSNPYAYYNTTTLPAADAETDPKWTGNYTAYNASWSSTYNVSYVPYTGSNANVVLGDYDFSVGSSDLFVDASAGNVGINTSSPQTALDVQGSIRTNFTNGITEDGLLLDFSGTVGRVIASDVYSGSGSQLAFYTGDGGAVIEQVRIDEFGSVGIGITTPASLLHVDGGDINITGGAGAGNLFVNGSAYFSTTGMLSTSLADWGIIPSGENLFIREPEDSDKTYLSIYDDNFIGLGIGDFMLNVTENNVSANTMLADSYNPQPSQDLVLNASSGSGSITIIIG